MDAVKLSETLANTCTDDESTESTENSLGAALKNYERIQAPEVSDPSLFSNLNNCIAFWIPTHSLFCIF